MANETAFDLPSATFGALSILLLTPSYLLLSGLVDGLSEDCILDLFVSCDWIQRIWVVRVHPIHGRCHSAHLATSLFLLVPLLSILVSLLTTTTTLIVTLIAVVILVISLIIVVLALVVEVIALIVALIAIVVLIIIAILLTVFVANLA